MFILAHLSVFSHGCLALLLWACDNTEHRGSSMWQRRAVHFMAAQKQREKRRRDQDIPFKGLPLRACT